MQKLYLKQLFVAVLALLCSVMANAHDFEVDGIFYNINGSEVTVTYKGDTYSDYSNEYSGNVLIPNSVTYNGNTYSVTRIGERAFCNCSGLTSVTIPNIVSSIGFAAFERCSGLTSVIIGNSVTSIANYAFYDCVRLARVEIPNSVTSIGYNAYFGCGNLKTVINFSTLQLSKGSTYGGYIAYYADKLVNVPNGFIKDGFAWCKIDGENILCGYVGNNIQFTLPDNCDGEDYAIGKSTFEGCCGLMSIEIPNSVTSIGDSAFYGCSGLTSVKIGNSVTNINDDAFGGCTNLNNIFYTSAIPPTSLWLAVNTYVPNIEDYAKSTISGGNGNFIEYVTYKNTNFTYGEIPQTVFVNNLESFGYTTNVIFPKLSTNAGTYTINIPFTFTKGNNHFDVNIPYKYIINKAPLVVKTDSFSRLYGEENPSFTITYSGFVNGEDESVLTNKGTATTSATAKSDVGDYYIVVSGAAAENYEMQYEKGSLTINKAPLTIAVNNASKVYGDGNPKLL